MKCLTTCVNFSDYLAVTLPLNLKFFDELVVVTSEEDTKTQDLAKKNNVSLVVTNSFYADHAPFNKGKALNEGLKLFGPNDWVCHLDADIVLSDSFSSVKEGNLDPNALYSCLRITCYSLEDWNSFKNTGIFNVKSRFQEYFMPIGYFQLFNMGAECLRKKPLYPDLCPTAAESDTRFSSKFKKYHFFKGLHVIELPTIGPHSPGVNWSGRKTPLFEGC